MLTDKVYSKAVASCKWRPAQSQPRTWVDAGHNGPTLPVLTGASLGGCRELAVQEHLHRRPDKALKEKTQIQQDVR